MENEYEIQRKPERRHCPDHTGMEEKDKGLQGQISSRLNLMIGLLTLIIGISVGGTSYTVGAISAHDRTISRLEDRQSTMMEDVKALKEHYDVIDKRVDDLNHEASKVK